MAENPSFQLAERFHNVASIVLKPFTAGHF
jgi:hypothetical protein